MSKNIMTLSKAEKLKVATELFSNANKKRSSSIKVLNDDKASAVSLQILSMEEDIKGLILVLDYYGFPLLKEVKDVHNIFKNHKLRYITGLILSVTNLILDDLKQLNKMTRDTNRLKRYQIDSDFLLNDFVRYSVNRIATIKKEVDLFSRMEKIRQKAMYVDFRDEISSPQNISEKDFELVSERVVIINKSIQRLKKMLEIELISKGSIKDIKESNFAQILNLITGWAKKNNIENLKQIIPLFDEYIEYVNNPAQLKKLRDGIEKSRKKNKK
jgi:AbiV family abortive infection protein